MRSWSGVHVLDEAGQQVAAPERGQPGRGQSLQPLVDADPQVGQDAQGGVVADQAFAVAEQTPGRRRRTARR